MSATEGKEAPDMNRRDGGGRGAGSRGRSGPAALNVIVWAALAVGLTAGCATNKPAVGPPTTVPVPKPRVTTAEPPQTELRADLVRFGKLRTVIRARELAVGPDGAITQVSEIGPALERDLAARDFRIFAGSVKADSPIAEMVRQSGAQLIVEVDAKSEFVNTTGRFAKYRATADVRAVRGRDGSLLARSRFEEMGERSQDDKRAAVLALRALQDRVAQDLVGKLMAKAEQILWAGLIVGDVPTLDMAVEIRNTLEKSGLVDYAELLQWDDKKRAAIYEIIYGMEHESDLPALLKAVKGMRVKPTGFDPGSMEVLRKKLSNYK